MVLVGTLFEGRWHGIYIFHLLMNSLNMNKDETDYRLESIAGTSFDAAESGPPPLHSVRCPDHCCQESFPQDLKVRRLKMH